MNHKYSFRECYQILGISPGCNWDDLRKSYKHLIQKWHPDRFKSGSEKQLVANEKISRINLAYSELSKYYRLNNALPDIENEDHLKQKSTLPENKTVQESDVQKKSPNVYTTSTTKPEWSIKNRYYLIIILIIFLYFLIILPMSNEENAWLNEVPENLVQKDESTSLIINSDLPDSREKNNSSNKHLTLDSNDIQSQSSNDDYFTFGSTIGELISIQGPPDKIVNDVWYYGDSEVHIKDGVVFYWKRSSGSVLNARLNADKFMSEQKQ